MSSLVFARIINPVCSCGNYVGRFQPEIEFRLIDMGGNTDDVELVKIMNDMKIKKMCCRSTILISPVLRLLQTRADLNIYKDHDTVEMNMERLTVGNPDSPQIE